MFLKVLFFSCFCVVPSATQFGKYKTNGIHSTTPATPNITGRPHPLEFSNTSLSSKVEKQVAKDLVLSCEPKAVYFARDPTNKTIKWLKNNFDCNGTCLTFRSVNGHSWPFPTNTVNFTCIVRNASSLRDNIIHSFSVTFKESLDGSTTTAKIQTFEVFNQSSPQIVEVREGVDFDLACNATELINHESSLHSTKITWLINNRTSNMIGKFVTIRKPGPNDFGNYTCVVQNQLHKIPLSHTIMVTRKERVSPVKIIVKPENITRRIGKSAVMGNNKVIGSTSELSLMNISKKDEGWYTCSVSRSTTDPIETPSAYLRVIDDEHINSSIIKVVIGAIGLIFISSSILFFICIRRRCKNQAENENVELGDLIDYDKVIVINKPTDSSDGLNGHFGLIQVEIRNYENRNWNSERGMLIRHKYKMPPPDEWEFPRERVSFEKIIGEGEFGEVHKALAYGIVKPDVSTEVAIKKLKVGHDDIDMKNLVMELEIMKIIGKHRNIVNLLGCCSQRGDLLVITEFASRGNLLLFLRSFSRSPCIGSSYVANKPDVEELMGYALQIARGMQFLTEKNCVHRDLAARNVLVDENFVMKIADFGLARTLDDKNYYSRKTKNVKLPFKWMAPEVFSHNKYTSESDVWSFGVLLWEIMTLGGVPYPEIMQYSELYKSIISNKRMQKPPNCPLKIYHLMNECWQYDSERRPSFETIVTFLEDTIGGDVDEGTMSSNVSNFYSSHNFTDSEEDLIVTLDEYS